MPRLATARDIATEALELIGAYGVNDVGPDPTHVDRALRSFDSIVQELAGTEEVWWLRPGEVSLTLTATIASYNLMTVLGADYPANAIEHLISAKLISPTGTRSDLDIIRRDSYYAKGDLTEAGPPREIYVDRLVPHLTLYTHPVIGVADYSIKLSFQSYAPDIVDEKTGAEMHNLPPAWQRWAKYAVAYDISGGSVMALSRGDRQGLKQDAEAARARLMAVNNRERARKNFVTPRDF